MEALLLTQYTKAMGRLQKHMVLPERLSADVNMQSSQGSQESISTRYSKDSLPT
jgi:hypothetical protein